LWTKEAAGSQLLTDVATGFRPAAVFGLLLNKMIKLRLFGSWPAAIAKSCSCLMHLLIIAMLLLIVPASAHSQEILASTPADTRTHPKPGAETKNGSGHTDTTPLRWDRYDWLCPALVIGAAAGLYAYDQNIRDWAQGNRGPTTDHIARLVKPFGEGYCILPALGMVYMYGYMDKDQRAKRIGLLGTESFAISGALVQALKHVTHRHRPGCSDRYNMWDGPGFSNSNLSFASGHSASAFSVATVIASEYEDKLWVPPLAYGLATLTALSRINDDEHWASDVLVGSAIGYFTAKTIIKLHQDERGLAVAPAMVGNGLGVVISCKF
jgi:PAP2 superfamily